MLTRFGDQARIISESVITLIRGGRQAAPTAAIRYAAGKAAAA
jgi:hypothetical protein